MKGFTFPVSTTGYKKNSPDVDNDYNVIPSNKITMKDVEFDVKGTDNLGNTKVMKPGKDYTFEGDYVIETPMKKSRCWKGYEPTPGKKAYSKGSCKKASPNKQTNQRTKGEGRHFRTSDEGAGMTKEGVASYKNENPGSKLQTAVTGDVTPGSKDAKRRKSFCARSKGWTGERGKAARKRWRC